MHLFNKDRHMVDCKSFSNKGECREIFDRWMAIDNQDGYIHICPFATHANDKYSTTEERVKRINAILPELPQDSKKIVRLPTINKSIYNTPIYNYD